MEQKVQQNFLEFKNQITKFGDGTQRNVPEGNSAKTELNIIILLKLVLLSGKYKFHPIVYPNSMGYTYSIQ